MRKATDSFFFNPQSEIRIPQLSSVVAYVTFSAARAGILFRSYSIKDVSNEAATISLRPIEAEDEAFLYEVYASTRAEEVAAWGWDERQRELFLKMQLKARDQSHPMYYQGIDDRIILCENEQSGRMIVSRNPEEIRLVDISLLPEYRNAGVGTSLIKSLFAEADETGRAVRLQVEKANVQARRLYERLGFSLTGETQTHLQMERKSKDEDKRMNVE